jgi:hypothetical protein
MKVSYKGTEYTMPENPLFGEISYVERKLKQPMDEWSKTTNVQAMIFWAVRRGDPTALSWEDLDATSPNDYDLIDDETDGDDADPPAQPPNSSPDGLVEADALLKTDDSTI